jgi:hypothetical protein
MAMEWNILRQLLGMMRTLSAAIVVLVRASARLYRKVAAEITTLTTCRDKPNLWLRLMSQF